MTRRIAVCSALAALVLAMLPTTGASASASTAAPRNIAVHAAAIVPNGSWTTYHRDDARTGYDPSAPAAGSAVVTPGWTMPALDGQVYAEVLVFNGLIYTATLNDTVYALNQIDGSIVWSRHVGTPQTSGWGCGNVNPTGILGTPVIDPVANRIYVVAEIVVNGLTTYHLYGLDLANAGSIVFDRTLLTGGFDWRIEQERGALGLRSGTLYVPFGGRAGDCGNYHGYVFAVSTSTGNLTGVYTTPGQGMGIWSAGGVVIDDATGNVFVSTGNGTGTGCDATNTGAPVYENDAVARLAPVTVVHQDFFMPQDWKADWCDNDQDIGSIAPILLNSSLLFQTGKWGTGFLLNPNALGGVDGQLYPTPKPNAYVEADTCLGNHSDATFGSAAYASPFIYLECDGHGLVALNVNTGTPSFSPCSTCASPDWHAGTTSTFGPPIVAGGAVWVVSTSGAGLYAFNQTTGAQLFHSASFGVNRFVTPTEAGGQVFVPSGNVIRSYTFGITFTPSHMDFGGIAPTTTSAAQTVTLHNYTASTLNISAVGFAGANPSDYAKSTDTCTGAAVASSGTCSVQVTFTPPSFGGFPAALTFTDDGVNSPQSVPLNGTGAIDNRGHVYTLDGYGGLHADGAAPGLAQSAYWGGFNIARSAALFPDGTGGYVLDGYGGLHQFGSANPVGGFAYWPGFDIARQVVFAPWATPATPAGWTLDGYGGVHAFGGAPTITGTPRWGIDVARGIVILPDSTPSAVAGYTFDGYGGVHAFGGAPAVGNFAYWGWDIGRGIALSPDASITNPSGWTFDGYGGIHPFGNAPAVAGSPRWGIDIGRGIISWTASGSGSGGWVLDGYGGIHPFGSAAGISPFPYWSGWDIATTIAASTSNSGSRHHR